MVLGRLLIPSRLDATSSQKIPDSMSFMGEVDCKASKEGKQTVIYMTANTGKPMQLAGYPYDVVVDLQGAEFDKEITPIIGDHNTKLRYGKTTEQAIVPFGQTKSISGRTVVGPIIAAAGVRSSASKFAVSTETDLKQQFPFQVSIGAKIKAGYFVEEGDSVNVNGQNWKGPLIVASKTRIRELTLAVLGADNDTSVEIAAKASLGVSNVNFTEWLKSLGLKEDAISASALTELKAKYEAATTKLTPPEPENKTIKNKKVKKTLEATDTEDDTIDPMEQFRNNAANETLRVNGIRATAANFPDLQVIKIKDKEVPFVDFQAHAIKNNMSIEAFELECRRQDYPTAPTAPAFHINAGGWDSRAVEVGILRASGLVPMKAVNAKNGTEYGIEMMYDQKVLEASDNRKYQLTGSIDELLDITIRASGHIPTARSGVDLFAQAHDVWNKLNGRTINASSGFSSLVLTNILENVANKTAMASFQAAEVIWNQLVSRRPANDFKPQSLYTLDLDGSFKKVATDGELKHISMKDSKKTISPDTFGAMISIDRKTRRNDDLGLVMQKASALGSLAAVRIEESVFVLLLSNPGSFFATGNNNLISGGSSVLGIDSVQTAKQKFLDQTLYGRPITVSPSILLTGTTNDKMVNDLYNKSEFALGMGNTDTGLVSTRNPHAGQFRPLTSGWINNTSIKDQDGNSISGQSSTQWYLMASPSAPQGSALVISFLDGRETPYFDQAETEFNVPGGIQMRSYMDWGVAMHITQMAVKSAGA